MDSSTKNLGEVEYEKKYCLQREKIQSGRKIRSDGYLQLPLFKNRSITKKFPIKTFLKMMDSSIENHGKVEYDKQNCLQHQNPSAWPKNLNWGLRPIANIQKSIHYKKVSN
jgi:hypothetical protein